VGWRGKAAVFPVILAGVPALVISMLAGERFCAPCLAAACFVWLTFLIVFASKTILAVLIAVLALVLPWFYQEKKAPPVRQVAPLPERLAQVEELSPPANQREPCG